MTNLILSKDIIADGKAIVQTASYKYLGQAIFVRKDNQIITIRVTWVVLSKLNFIFKLDITLRLKMIIYQRVLPLLGYGAKTLTLTKKSIHENSTKGHETRISLDRDFSTENFDVTDTWTRSLQK